MKIITCMCFASAAIFTAFAAGTFMNNEGAAAWMGLAFWLVPAGFGVYAPFHTMKQLQKQKIQHTKIGSAW